jgi:hypothetical protein
MTASRKSHRRGALCREQKTKRKSDHLGALGDRVTRKTGRLSVPAHAAQNDSGENILGARTKIEAGDLVRMSQDAQGFERRPRPDQKNNGHGKSKQHREKPTRTIGAEEKNRNLAEQRLKPLDPAPRWTTNKHQGHCCY